MSATVTSKANEVETLENRRTRRGRSGMKRKLEAISDDNKPKKPAKKAKSTHPKGTSTSSGQMKEDNFVGTASGYGHTIEKHPHATLDAPWHCGNRMCTTGQTWLERGKQLDREASERLGKEVKIEGLGRKTVSHYFGRNKNETKRIPVEVWHWYCRKCYQHGDYDAKHRLTSSEIKGGMLIGHVEMQLDRLKLWRPDATFKVQLTKSARLRLKNLHEQLERNKKLDPANRKTEKEIAEEMTVAPKVNKNGNIPPLSRESAFAALMLREWDTQFAGEGKTLDHLYATMRWTRRRFNNGEITTMPPIEFLINNPAVGEIVHDPASNYWRWFESMEIRERSVDSGKLSDVFKSEAIEDSDEEADDAVVITQSNNELPDESKHSERAVTDDEGDGASTVSQYGESTRSSNFSKASAIETPATASEATKEEHVPADPNESPIYREFMKRITPEYQDPANPNPFNTLINYAIARYDEEREKSGMSTVQNTPEHRKHGHPCTIASILNPPHSLTGCSWT